MTDRRDPTPEERAAGQVLKDIRLEKGLTATAVAYRLGMGEQNVLRYESGRNQLSILQVRDFAWALEVEPRVLLERLTPLLRLSAESDMERRKRIASFEPETLAHVPVDRRLALASA